MRTDVTLPYNGLTLDRARRADADWLARALASGRVLAFWQDRCLVTGGRPVSLERTDREVVFLGAAEAGVFATDLSDVDLPAAVGEAGAAACWPATEARPRVPTRPSRVSSRSARTWRTRCAGSWWRRPASG